MPLEAYKLSYLKKSSEFMEDDENTRSDVSFPGGIGKYVRVNFFL